jgi:hypothetical protein
MSGVNTILSAVVLAAMVLGCATPLNLEAERVRSPLHHAAEEALTHSWQVMVQQRSLDAGLVWNLQQVLRMRPDQELQPFMDDAVGKLAGTSYERLVNPEAPRAQLPEDPGSGAARLSNYLKAPLGEPRERAIEWIAEYVEEPGYGYTLTHQLLVLQWARQTGLELPDFLIELQPELLRLIEEEQNGAPVFSDIYAERTGLLLMYGSPPSERAEGWVRIIVDRQLDDGMWDASRGGVAGRGSKHATGWCMVALAAYLDNY